MESPMTSHLTLSDLERSNSRSLRFQSFVSCKGAELGHMLLLNNNMKAYMVWLHLKLSDLERSMSRSSKFWKLMSSKGAELLIGHMLLLNINMKLYMGSQIELSHLTLSDLERSISRSHRFQRLISRKAAQLGHMILLNTNRKSYMGSLKPSSHLTLSDLERSKLMCRMWSNIDTYTVRHCVRVNPEFNWFGLQQFLFFYTSLPKIANVIPTAAVKQSATVHGPLVCNCEMYILFLKN